MSTPNTLETQVTIIPFEPQYAADFGKLNYEWLEAYFEVEPHDREMLDFPESYIMDRGGHIFFAKLGDEIVGTCALLVETPDSYELAKMAVRPDLRGLRIGQKLIEHAIAFSKNTGMKKLVLESSTKLENAIKLYIKTGFREIPMSGCSPYARCNIRMDMDL